ncbi:microtubule associated protein-domain-containing protein [Choanephora cucurbitarum]|nr:microtubule associated protein-domain-containing protein [Choanephora cucurbitarum]
MTTDRPIHTLEQLHALLEQQLERLVVVQKEIGLTQEEQENQTSVVLSSAIQSVKHQVDKVYQSKQEMLSTIESVQGNILSFKKLMGEFASNTAVLHPQKSLVANLTDIMQERDQVQQRYDQRLSHVKDLYEQLNGFKIALGDFVNTSLMMSSEIDVSSLAVNALEEEIQRCQIEYANRKQSVEEGVNRIMSLCVLMGLEPQSELDKAIEQFYREQDPDHRMHLFHQLVTQDILSYITQRVDKLEEQKQQIEFRKEEIGHNLKRLWSRLHEDPQACETFLMTHRGLTCRELEKYEEELARMLKLKQERIGDFIQTAREELESLWNQLYYSDQQRAQFAPAQTDEWTDAVLEAHENEICRLQLEIEDSKYILELIEKHMRLKKEIEEFEATTSDPNRLFGKGQRDPGRLLREEKFRKRISRELPKVTKELEGALLEFEALKGYPFLVYGQPYFNVIYGDDLKEPESQDKPDPPVKKEEVTQPPRTPRRDATPLIKRKPLTSPRLTRSKPSIFNTPQPNRVRNLHLSSTHAKERKYDSGSTTILHRIRETNIRKQKTVKRSNLFDEDSDEEEVEEENRAPIHQANRKHKHSKRFKHGLGQSDSDDNIGLDLGIFDDGPDLSDMSEAEDA